MCGTFNWKGRGQTRTFAVPIYSNFSCTNGGNNRIVTSTFPICTYDSLRQCVNECFSPLIGKQYWELLLRCPHCVVYITITVGRVGGHLAGRLQVYQHASSCVVGITNTVGRVGAGWLADFKCVNTLLVHNIAVLGAGAVCILNMFCTTFPLLVLFAACFGFCIGE